ncbi:MAG: lysophospholipid acyltransferase family protein, partial [Pyrinomonadaceae bacterium]
RPAGFSIDGPRGPRYVTKMGAVLLAKKTGQPILPFTVNTERYLSIRSWDRLQIPSPFTRAQVRIAEPIWVTSNANETELRSKLLLLQESLDRISGSKS